MSDPGIEIATEAAKAAAVEIVAPVTGILADVFGGLIGDRIRNWRTNKPAWQEKNQTEIAERAARKLRDRGVNKASEEANPVLVEEILEAAKNTTAEELKELYAGLVAAAMDPGRVEIYRREFVGIANELEPIDAIALPLLAFHGGMAGGRVNSVGGRLKRGYDEVVLAFRNLHRLGLITDDGLGPNETTQPQLTPLGRQLLNAVR